MRNLIEAAYGQPVVLETETIIVSAYCDACGYSGTYQGHVYKWGVKEPCGTGWRFRETGEDVAAQEARVRLNAREYFESSHRERLPVCMGELRFT